MAANDPYFSYTKLLLHMDAAALPDIKGHTVTPVGNAARSSAQSKFGGYSAYFDGSGDYLSVASSVDFALGSADFTVELWVYPQATANLYPMLIGRSSGTWTANEWSLDIDHTGAPNKYSVWVYNINSAVPVITSASNVAYDGWYHVALTRTGTTWRLFVDGVLEGSATSSAALTGVTGDPLLIGNQYLGYLDEVRVTKGYSRYPSDSSFSPPGAAFPDYDRYLAGSLTESVPLTDWQVLALRVDTNAVINEQTVTGTDFELPLMIAGVGYSGPVWLIGRPKVGAIWTPNTPKAVGDYAFPTGPETTPYLFVATGISDAYLASVKLLLNLDGANDGTAFTDRAGHAMTRNGNVVTKTSEKKFGSASAYFDGAGDWLSTPSAAEFSLGTGDFTLEGWLNITNYGTGRVWFDTRSVWNDAGFTTYVDTDGLVKFYNAGAIRATSGSTVSTGTWTHVAIVRQSGTLKIYVNGVGGSGASYASAVTCPGSVRIGVDCVGNAGWAGYLDDIRFTPGVARYTGNFSPPAEPFQYGTGLSEPTWPTTPGNTVVDGGVTWQCKGRMVQPVMHGPLIPSI